MKTDNVAGARHTDPGLNTEALTDPDLDNGGPTGYDTRSPDQRRHDILAELLLAAAAADAAPTLDGHPVTVIVTVTAEELHRHDGLDGDPIGVMTGNPAPVSRARVTRFIDAGGYRTITLNNTGAITRISSPERCFRPHQKAAIAARDGNRCATPGCSSPHYTLQTHHVTPWRDGGPTTTDNGILLCYWHHHHVDNGPWRYQMINGRPHVRGPNFPTWTPLRPPRTHAA